MDSLPPTSTRSKFLCHSVPGYRGYVRGWEAGTFYPVSRVAYDGTPWGLSGQPEVYEPRNPVAGTAKWKKQAIPHSTDDIYADRNPRLKTNSKNKSDFVLGDNRDRFWDTTYAVTFVDASGSANNPTRAPMFENWEDMSVEEKDKVYKRAYELVGKDGLKKLENSVRSKIEQRTAGGPFVLRKAFKYFDRDGSGDIDPDEFFAAMEYFGLTFTDDEVIALFGTYDDSRDGSLDYYEFIDKVLEKDFVGVTTLTTSEEEKNDIYKEMANKVQAKEEYGEKISAFKLYRQRLALKRVFEIYDADQSGAIDDEEIKRLLEAAGMDSTQEGIQEVFDQIDANNDGNLSFDEIWKWWTKNLHVDHQEICEHEMEIEKRKMMLKSKGKSAHRIQAVKKMDSEFEHVGYSDTAEAYLDHSADHALIHDPTKIVLDDHEWEKHAEFIGRGNSLIKVQNGKLIHDKTIRRPKYNMFGAKRRWAIPKTERGDGKCGSKLQSAPHTEEASSGPAPPQELPKLLMPEPTEYPIPNSPKVPKSGLKAVRNAYYRDHTVTDTGPDPPKAPRTERFRRRNVGEFTERDTGFTSSSLPWVPQTARPHAEHNPTNSSWFGGKFQNATPAGWSSSRIQPAKRRPLTCPEVQPSPDGDGRPVVQTGFRLPTGNVITGRLC